MLSRPDKLCGVCEGCDLATCCQANKFGESKVHARVMIFGTGFVWMGHFEHTKKKWAAWVIWRLKRSEGGGFLFRKPVDCLHFDIWRNFGSGGYAVISFI